MFRQKVSSSRWSARIPVAGLLAVSFAGFFLNGCGEETDEGSGRRKKSGNSASSAPGYGPDLAEALKRATSDLEAGKVDMYLTGMLPVIELKQNSIADLEKRLKASPEIVKQMIADLKRLEGKKPRLESGGDVAVFEFPNSGSERPSDGVSSRVTVGVRIFKFQKSGGNWRLYDNTTAMRNASIGFAR